MGVFLWSSKRTGKDRREAAPTQQQSRGDEEEEEEEEDARTSSLVLQGLEAACLEELVFDPESDYAQVLAEARSYARKAAESSRRVEDCGEHCRLPKSSRQSKNTTKSQRTAKIYFVPPPILDFDRDHAKKKSKSWSWKDPLLLFWRSGQKSSQNPKNHENAARKKRFGSASGPLPLYTDGNGQNPRPWHKKWDSNDSRTASGPLAAMSCTTRQDAASPYVPLNGTSGARKWTSGPLYVTT